MKNWIPSCYWKGKGKKKEKREKIEHFSFFTRYGFQRLLVFLNSPLRNSQVEWWTSQNQMLALESKLLLIKSICLALLIAFCSVVQCWDVRIHSVIRCFEQPLPRKNSISLNVFSGNLRPGSKIVAITGTIFRWSRFPS